MPLNGKEFQVSCGFLKLKELGIREKVGGKIPVFEGSAICCRYADTPNDKKSSDSEVLPKSNLKAN